MIIESVILIEDSLEEIDFVHCVHKELSHSIGVRGDISYANTIFHTTGGADRMTDLDICIVQLIYSEYITNNMRINEFREAAESYMKNGDRCKLLKSK